MQALGRVVWLRSVGRLPVFLSLQDGENGGLGVGVSRKEGCLQFCQSASQVGKCVPLLT